MAFLLPDPDFTVSIIERAAMGSDFEHMLQVLAINLDGGIRQRLERTIGQVTVEIERQQKDERRTHDNAHGAV